MGSEITRRRAVGEDGASLIIAMILLMVVSVAVLAVLGFAGNGLLSTAQLKAQRSLEYAADSATNAAVQGVRYSPYAFDGGTYGGVVSPTDSDCLPNGPALVIPDVAVMTINGQSMTVDCATANLPPTPQATRTVNFYACLTAKAPCTQAKAIVYAQVGYNDYSQFDIYLCSDSADVGTCGTGMTINQWIVETGNN